MSLILLLRIEMSISILPRILIIGPEPFNYTRGYGITISNLFKDWPKEKLVTLYFHDVPRDDSICSEQYLLEVKRKGANRRTNRAEAETRIIETQSQHRLSHIMGNVVKKFISKWFNIIGLGKSCQLGNFNKYLITGMLNRVITKFDPDLIYCTVTSLQEINIVKEVATKYNTPIVIHIMDDWIVNARRASGLIPQLWGRRIDNRYAWLIHNSALRLGIGSHLCDEYRERYHEEFLPFQNSPEADLWIAYSRSEWENRGVFRFVFTGGVYDSCNKNALLQIAETIDYINRFNGRKYQLDIYTNSPNINEIQKLIDGYFGCSVVAVKSDQTEIAKLLGSSDALVLPFDFSEEAKAASRFSMPTKLPVYMLSASPMFVYGPCSTSAVRYIKKSKTGYILDKESSKEEIARHMIEFSQNHIMRKKVSLRAQIKALSLSAEVVRPKFIKSIVEAANQ